MNDSKGDIAAAVALSMPYLSQLRYLPPNTKFSQFSLAAIASRTREHKPPMMTLKTEPFCSRHPRRNPYLSHIMWLRGSGVVVNRILQLACENGAIRVASNTCRYRRGGQHNHDRTANIAGYVGGDPALVILCCCVLLLFRVCRDGFWLVLVVLTMFAFFGLFVAFEGEWFYHCVSSFSLRG